jgi:hypothetical protein
MFIRPEGIHSGEWFGSGDHKDLRASLLLHKMETLDLVILQVENPFLLYVQDAASQ